MSCWQGLQVLQHPTSNPTPTISPTLNFVTSGPTSTTSPTTSCLHQISSPPQN
uniref:Cinnamyl alcohol dehydrogenase n=1 Tax=Solanum tuberosum TaxID=4113 RepID=M1CF77_SOLTU